MFKYTILTYSLFLSAAISPLLSSCISLGGSKTEEESIDEGTDESDESDESDAENDDKETDKKPAESDASSKKTQNPTSDRPSDAATTPTPSVGFQNLPVPNSPLNQDSLRTFVQKHRSEKTYDEVSVKDKCRVVVRIYEPMLQPDAKTLSSTQEFLKKIGPEAHWVFFETALMMVEKIESSKTREEEARNNLIIYTNALKLIADSLDQQVGSKTYLNMAKNIYQDVMQNMIKPIVKG